MTIQQKTARHISFSYIRSMKHFNQYGIAHQVIVELWIKGLITYTTKCNLIKWLYA